jgi:tripartite-type tricarboxylate transporter receptor subunit TctC
MVQRWISGWLALAASSAALTGCMEAWAQVFPSKAVRVVVPYAPGGAGDIMARTIALRLTESWGQQVIVENRPGAAGMIGAAAVAKANPDGYTVLLGYTSEIAVNPSLYRKMAYDPLQDLAPVTLAGILPLLLVSNPSLPVRTVRDIVTLARTRPGEMTYGSAGSGTPAHLGMEYLKRTAGIDITHIPYKGGSEVVTAILGGHVMLFFSGIPPAIPHVKSGRLRPIAVSTRQRARILPDVPTVEQSGIRGFDLSGWFGYFVPTGTPREVIDKFHAAVNSILMTPEVVKQFDQQGIITMNMTPEAFSSFIRSEFQKYSKIVRESGAQVN